MRFDQTRVLISLSSLCFQEGFSNVVFWEDCKGWKTEEKVLSVEIVFLFVLPSPVNVIKSYFFTPMSVFCCTWQFSHLSELVSQCCWDCSTMWFVSLSLMFDPIPWGPLLIQNDEHCQATSVSQMHEFSYYRTLLSGL